MKKAASEIARHVNGLLVGEDIYVDGVCSLSTPRDGKIGFVTSRPLYYSPAFEHRAIFLVGERIEKHGNATLIVVDNPRLAFARTTQLLSAQEVEFGVHPTAIIHPETKIDSTSSVGAFCVIEKGVVIENNVIIENNVTLKKDTHIGPGTLVRSNTVIGGPGFGYEFDDDGKPVHLHHLGRVVIGENVEIGSCVVIARGTIDATIIGNDVKIDDHVFIAHNVQIGNRSVIIAGAEISGSVVVGEDCWISPQVTVINGVVIGDKSLIGIGAVVTKNVPGATVVVGNPGRVLRHRGD